MSMVSGGGWTPGKEECGEIEGGETAAPHSHTPAPPPCSLTSHLHILLLPRPHTGPEPITLLTLQLQAPPVMRPGREAVVQSLKASVEETQEVLWSVPTWC